MENAPPAAGYYRARETKERAALVQAYRKRDLIGDEYTNYDVVRSRARAQRHFNTACH